jgi:putative transposase
VRDALCGGCRFHALNELDEGNRQGLAIGVGTSTSNARIVRLMEQLIEVCGRPAAIRVDNGLDMAAQTFVDWCERHTIELRHIQSGRPDWSAYIAQCSRSYREKVLNAYVLESLEQDRALTENGCRPITWVVPTTAPIMSRR